jgi:negative regulator of sigma E activity
MAGRPCWILEIIPKEKNKHRQRVWIDQQTGVVLQIRRFRPEGRFTTLSRFVSFKPQNNLPSELFSLDKSSGPAVAHGLDPLAISLEEFKKEYGQSFSPPTELPAGFVFESANHFKVKSKDVWHLRYTDGLAALSLFLTRGPVSRPKNGQLLGDAVGDTAIGGVGQPVMYGFGKVLEWKKKHRYYILMGDVDRRWLEKIAAAIP